MHRKATPPVREEVKSVISPLKVLTSVLSSVLEANGYEVTCLLRGLGDQLLEFQKFHGCLLIFRPR